ncbi:MAG: ferredoxin III, nif-specific [Cyanobacteria bacterium P01_D01_bin.6]
MSYRPGVRSANNAWPPQFLQAINWNACLGCRRCLKACGRSVMALIALDEHGQVADADDDDAIERVVMSIANAENCTGCQACDRACPKSCHTYTPALA